MASTIDLQQAYLFQGLSDSDLEKVAAAVREATFEPGEYVYKKGDRGLTFYVIAEGKVELISQERDGTVSVFGHISTGGHFGEVSLFTGKPRSLSVRTLTVVRLLCFAKEQFAGF